MYYLATKKGTILILIEHYKDDLGFYSISVQKEIYDVLFNIFNDVNEIESFIIKYLNRLSDYLFVLARFLGHSLQVNEIPWKPRM